MTLNMDVRIAFITGITGQDGSYLAEYLLFQNYEVHGFVRDSSSSNMRRIESIRDLIHIHYGDITDYASVLNTINELYEDDTLLEIYHLAAQSHIDISLRLPITNLHTDALGTLHLLEAVRQSIWDNANVRIYNASTSEIFDNLPGPLSETSPMKPCSPYAASKLYAYNLCILYRETYAMYITNGIMFNHTSPRQDNRFVVKKIVLGAVNQKFDPLSPKPLLLGNLDAQRDIGHAKEYVEVMWRLLQQDRSTDIVVATGKTCSIRQLCTIAFDVVGLPIVWETPYLAVDKANPDIIRVKGHQHERPIDPLIRHGDPSSIKNTLNWSFRRTVHDIIKSMVNYELLSTR